MSLTQVVRPDAAAAGREALPLPAPAWGVPEALAALDRARPVLPVDLPAPVVVSSLTTVVLRCGRHAVKVYPPGTDAAHLERARRALLGLSAAVVPTCPPVVTAHGVVTVMPWLPTAGPVTWAELGGLLRTFHREAAGADVPAWMPLSRLPGQVASLPPEQAAVLMGARAELLAALAGLDSELGVGPIHGDVSPENGLRTDRGPRLIDLDWVACAPREYDLASAARRRASGEIGRSEYAGFCAAYGADVRGWAGLPVLHRLADLGGLAFRLWDSRRHGHDLDWLDGELRRWRTPL